MTTAGEPLVAGRYTIWKQFTFESAHALPNLPAKHKCARMHGHNYTFRLYVAGSLNHTLGWVTDFGGILSAAGGMVTQELDHRTLNDIPGLENPTAEVLAWWIAERVLKTQLGNPVEAGAARLVAVEVQETPGSCVRLECA